MKARVFFLFLLFITSTTVFAVNEGDPALLASCRALSVDLEQEAAKPCHYYIQGFLALARAVDTAKQQETSSSWSAFEKRAYRTRVGKKIDSAPAACFSCFCLPDGETEIDIIKRISRKLSLQANTDNNLRESVYHALVVEFPCN